MASAGFNLCISYDFIFPILNEFSPTGESSVGPTTEATQLATQVESMNHLRQTIQRQEEVISEKQTRVEELEAALAQKDLLMAQCEEARMEIISQINQEAEWMDTNLLRCEHTIVYMNNILQQCESTIAYMDANMLQCESKIVDLSEQIRNPGWIKVENKHYQDTECPNVGNFWDEHLEAASLDDCKSACLRDIRCTAVSFHRSQTGTSNSCTLRACSFPIPMPSQSGIHDSYYQDRQGKY